MKKSAGKKQKKLQQNVVSYFWDTYLSLRMMPPPAEAEVAALAAARDAAGDQSEPDARAVMPVAASTGDSPRKMPPPTHIRPATSPAERVCSRHLRATRTCTL